jgi:hypothetical protein
VPKGPDDRHFLLSPDHLRYVSINSGNSALVRFVVAMFDEVGRSRGTPRPPGKRHDDA